MLFFLLVNFIRLSEELFVIVEKVTVFNIVLINNIVSKEVLASFVNWVNNNSLYDEIAGDFCDIKFNNVIIYLWVVEDVVERRQKLDVGGE